MNPRLRKDIRLIAPTWVLMLLVLMSISFISRFASNDARGILSIVLAIASAVVAALLFAHEFQAGTAVWLLGLPMSRRGVYTQKHLVLLGALVVFWLVAFPGYMRVRGTANFYVENALLALLIPVLALATVCYWSLVTRNVLYAIVLSLFVPFVLLLGALLTLSSLHHRGVVIPEYKGATVVIGGILTYGLFIAWRGWVRWKRLEITGNAILHSPADLKFSQKLFSRIQRGRTGPTTALVVKEIGLQRFVLGLMALNVVIIILGLIFTGPPGAGVGKNYWALSLGFANNCFLFLTPVLCGAMALAEERQMKVFPWMTLLPVSMRKQWAVKLGLAMTISVIGSLFIPLVGNFLRAEAGATAGLLDPDLIPRMIQINLCLFATAYIFSSMFDTSVKAVIATGLALCLSGFLVLVITSTLRPLLADMVMLTFSTLLDARPYVSRTDIVDWLGYWPGLLFGPALLAGLIFSFFNFRNHGVTLGRMLVQFTVMAALIVVGAFITMLCIPFLMRFMVVN